MDPYDPMYYSRVHDQLVAAEARYLTPPEPECLPETMLTEENIEDLESELYGLMCDYLRSDLEREPDDAEVRKAWEELTEALVKQWTKGG